MKIGDTVKMKNKPFDHQDPLRWFWGVSCQVLAIDGLTHKVLLGSPMGNDKAWISHEDLEDALEEATAAGGSSAGPIVIFGDEIAATEDAPVPLSKLPVEERLAFEKRRARTEELAAQFLERIQPKEPKTVVRPWVKVAIALATFAAAVAARVYLFRQIGVTSLAIALVALSGCSSAQIATAKSDLHAAFVAADEAVTAAEADPTLIPRVADAAAALDAKSAALQSITAKLKAAATTGNLDGLHGAIGVGIQLTAPPATSPAK